MATSVIVSPEQEQAWIAGLRKRNLEVFQAVFANYAPRLKKFVCLWVPPDVAEDIVQDVLFHLWQRSHDLHLRNTSLTAYLFSAVRRNAFKYHRHERVVLRSEMEEGYIDPPGMGMAIESPDTHVLTEDFYNAVQRGIRNLSDTQRSILMLRWTQGLSYAEIAEVLEISENAVKLHMSRTKHALRPFLRELLASLG